jgi:hypothetical protein
MKLWDGKMNNYEFHKHCRKTWEINPVEKIKLTKKKKNRSKHKQELRELLNEIQTQEE